MFSGFILFTTVITNVKKKTKHKKFYGDCLIRRHEKKT